MFRKLAVAAAVAALSLAGGAAAHEVKTGALTLTSLHVKASLKGVSNTAGYLTVSNAGVKPDRLLSASCACARAVQIHRMSVKGGIMRMTPVADGLPVPAKGVLDLKPGGDHLMLVGLKAPLADGTSVPMTLKFAVAGTVTTNFHVKADLDEHAGHAMPGMKH
jgi:copper(I)-binding protein